ncbi:Glucanosyltransferase-domain-containing protein [Scheffersomyces xylosifermentans]|uniref:Glucanosyltransferase-domain-containing protein n=1 Tax=Scheffersomyces xylosifermentans TaxID=1304137 RepID=UPI00315CE34A
MVSFIYVVLLGFILRQVSAYVHPLVIHGHYFIDSVTKKPFYIKGVDYQPGGSSGVTMFKDPLSNPDECARDIQLFQELGINTIRIYSINPDLNHDVCMSMLATAGIYLVLDVNSPLPNHHINRYEPWNSYNIDYLENVFKVVEQFSYYNNTLGFFAGNEIVNDQVSAKHSPVYVKAVIRDIKMYIEYNSPRPVPVGYSAADDLSYRMPFSEYLECVYNNPAESVDFYGVNSYQWCGEQTFYTSGYNLLVDDYSTYTSPVFFSEYGCNEVLPRMFEEVKSLYSKDMIDVFSGGLVYEFTQEPNNYGLVEIMPSGDVRLLNDYITLKSQLHTLSEIDYSHVANSMRRNAKEIQARLKIQKTIQPICEPSYPNIDVSKGLPKTIAEDLIEMGVDVARGKYVSLSDQQLTSKFKVYEPNGAVHPTAGMIITEVDLMSGSELGRRRHIKDLHNCTYSDTDSDYWSDEALNYEMESGGEEEITSTTIRSSIFQTVSTYFQKLIKSFSHKLYE